MIHDPNLGFETRKNRKLHHRKSVSNIWKFENPIENSILDLRLNDLQKDNCADNHKITDLERILQQFCPKHSKFANWRRGCMNNSCWLVENTLRESSQICHLFVMASYTC